MPYRDPEDARRQKRRYYADPDRAEQRRQYMRQYRSQQKALLAEWERMADPAVRAYRRASIAARRQVDPQYRQYMRDRNAARRAVAGRSTAPRSRQRWTPAEDQIVLSDIPLMEAALRLGRSYEAVAKRRRALRKNATTTEENRNV